MGGFSGALVHGLLGGIAGGADRYIKEDEERRKAELKKYEEEAAQMREQANMRLRVQLSEESAIRTENRAKETKEAERGERAGLLQSYAKQATELSDREINLGKVDDKYESFNRVADQATLDAQPEIATSLKGMAGLSPTDKAMEVAKLKEQERKAKGLSPQRVTVGGEGGEFAVTDDDGNVTYRKIERKPHVNINYHNSNDEDGGGGKVTKTRKLTPPEVRENAAIEAARIRVDKYNRGQRFVGQDKPPSKEDLELARKTKFGGDEKMTEYSKYGAKPYPAENKQPVAKTSGNVPKVKEVSMAEVLNAVNGDKAKAAKLAEAIRAKGGVVK